MLRVACVYVCACYELWFPHSATKSRVGLYVLVCACFSGMCALRAVVSTLYNVVSCRFVCGCILPVGECV